MSDAAEELEALMAEEKQAGHFSTAKGTLRFYLRETTTIAKMDFTTNRVELFDFDSYLDNREILHDHPADVRTRNRVLERVAVEKRLLDDPDPDDWIYISSDSKKGSHV